MHTLRLHRWAPLTLLGIPFTKEGWRLGGVALLFVLSGGPKGRYDHAVISYQTVGRAAAPAVMLLHGMFLDACMWSPLAEQLAHHHRVILVETPGHGAAPERAQPFTYWDLAQEVLKIVEREGVDRAALVGLSQGGFIALRAALLQPERVAGLVLLDTSAQALTPAERTGYETLFDQLRSGSEQALQQLATQLLGSHGAEREVWMQRWRQQLQAGILPFGQAAQCLLERDDVTARLGEITCPALVIRGEDDVSLPAEQVQALAAGLPGAAGRVEVIPGAAHVPPVTHPQPTAKLIREFLLHQVFADSDA